MNIELSLTKYSFNVELLARVAELVDAIDLGSIVLGRASSSLAPGTIKYNKLKSIPKGALPYAKHNRGDC